MPWRLEAVIGEQTLRAAAGDWLYPLRSEIAEPRPIDSDPWKAGVLDASLMDSDGRLGELPSADVLELDYDLVAGSLQELARLLAIAVTEVEADAILDAADTPPTRRVGLVRPPLAGGIEWVDLAVASAKPDRDWQCGVRHCLAFAGKNWLVTIWKGLIQPDDVFDAPEPRWDRTGGEFRYGPAFWFADTLPAFREPLVPGEARTGRELFDRLLQFVLGHHDWALLVCQDGLVRWETEFLADPASIDNITSRLEELRRIGQCIACVHFGCRGILRRSKRQPLFAGPDRGKIIQRAEQARGESAAARSELREAFSLASQMMAIAEAAASEERAEHMRHLEYAAAFVTAFVLIPSVIIGIYGANVDGLPRQDEARGLLVLGLATVITGVISVVVMLLLIRRRRRRP